MLELTVPWEEWMEKANNRIHVKYQDLVETCRGKGWKTYCEFTEVLMKLQKKPLGNFGSRWLIHGQFLLGCRLRPDQPWTGHLGEGV